jgi:hypothetical protein
MALRSSSGVIKALQQNAFKINHATRKNNAQICALLIRSVKVVTGMWPLTLALPFLSTYRYVVVDIPFN